METLKKSWPLLLVSALSIVLVVNGVLTANLYDSAQPAAVTDTVLVKKLAPPPAGKFKPVQPVAVTIAVTPDTLQRKAAEARPIITRARETPLRKNRALLEVEYIKPNGKPVRVATVIRPGAWEVRGDTIATVMQDRSSRRREWRRKAWRTTKHVALGAGIGAATTIGILIAK